MLPRRRKPCLEALQVGYERGIAHTRAARNAGHHFGRASHLRHPFGRDESGGLDMGKTGLREPIHQRDLDGGGNAVRLVLQAVARTHFDDPDMAGKGR